MRRRMLSVIAVTGLGLSVAALAATPTYAATDARPARAATDAPDPCRALDFETAKVTSIASTGSVPPVYRYQLTVTGTKPSTDVAVKLVPLVYVKQPAYWGIKVTGCSSGVGLPVLTPYTVTLDVTGTMGTCGIEVQGASRNQQIDVTGCTKPALAGTRWTLDPASIGVPVPAGQPITANFSDTTMSGSTSCNLYSASYTATADGSFKLGPIGITKRACEPVSATAERAFLKRLSAVDRYAQAPKKLELLAGEKPVLVFGPTPPAV